MMLSEFPANPLDGTVYELQPGIYFVFEAPSGAWVRVLGDAIFPLATPLTAGLMSATDYRKINSLVLPYQRTTISGENCTVRYISGNVAISGGDRYVQISGAPPVYDKAARSRNLPFVITRHTAAMDFTLDKNQLVADLISAGQLKLQGETGAKGLKGPPGDAGQGLQTGPKGPKGNRGTGPTCDLRITQDNLGYQVANTDLAIVGITTKATGPNAYQLVIQHGAIGNPNAAASSLQVDCGQISTWAYATTNIPGLTNQVNCAVGSPAGNLPVYYLDLFPILQAIQDKFESEALRIKTGHEQIVSFWLQQLQAVFDAQKQALCCSLFQCQKHVATLPKRAENLIDTQPLPVSITAGMLQGAATPMEAGRLVVTPANVGGHDSVAVTELPAGSYSASLHDCQLRVGPHFTGAVTLCYGNRHIKFIKLGAFTNQEIAKRAYEGLTVHFEHPGGPVGAYCPGDSQGAEGSLAVIFTRR